MEIVFSVLPSLREVDQVDHQHISSISHNNADHPKSAENTVRTFHGNSTSNTDHHRQKHGHSCCEHNDGSTCSAKHFTLEQH